MVLSNLISNTLKIIIMNALWLEKCVIIGVKVLEFCEKTGENSWNFVI